MLYNKDDEDDGGISGLTDDKHDNADLENNHDLENSHGLGNKR